MFRVAPLLSGVLLFFSLTSARGDALAKALEGKIKAAARDAGPAVVCIYVSRSEDYAKAPYWGVANLAEHPGQLGRFDAEAASKKVPADAKRRARILRTIEEHDLSAARVVPESFGSGLVVDKSGLVLTCAHVVKDATRIYVKLPNKTGSWADIYAADPRSDLAVLRLLDPPKDLAAYDIGQGAKVSKGQLVLCLSSAYTPNQEPTTSVDSGLLSNMRHRLKDEELLKETDQNRRPLSHYGILLETDARVTPSCSGGVLLDLEGKVVGLTSAIAGVRGDKPGGLAMPIDPATRQIVEVLKKGEEVEYGFLGVVLTNGSVNLAQVSPGSPASRAGLRPGDRIQSINGNPVHDRDDLFLYLGLTLAGKTAIIEVARNGRGGVEKIQVQMAKYYVPGPVIATKRPPAKFGLRVDYMSIMSQRNLFWNWNRMPTEGVVVREVIPSSPADKALLQPDKIITHVNDQRVNTPAEYYAIAAKATRSLKVTIQNSKGQAVDVKLEEK